MEAGIGQFMGHGDGIFVTNVSSINLHNLCDQRWYYQRVNNRVKPAIDADFLRTGRVGHAAVQDLHEVTGEWDPDAAVSIASTHAADLYEELNRQGNNMSDRDREKREWFASWLPRAFPLYAAKYRDTGWDEQLYVEEPMWLAIDVDDVDYWPFAADCPIKRLVVVGTPDAVVTRAGRVWHVQRKFFSPQTDLEQFLRKVSFQRHEILYLTIFDVLYEQGQLPYPAGHTVMDLVRKLNIPEDPDSLSPPKSCDCGAAFMDAFDDLAILEGHPSGRGKFAHTDGRRQHWIDEREKLARFHERVEKKRHESATFLSKAFVREPCRIRAAQRQAMQDHIWTDMLHMVAKEHGLLRVTPKEGPACNAFFRECPYVGVCAGRESIDGVQFVDRPHDYTDMPEEE